MDSESDSGNRIWDHRFLHLIVWEARLLGWGKRLTLRIAVVLAIVAAAMPCLWRAAIEREPLSLAADSAHGIAMIWLCVSPLHSAASTLTDMSFCYIVLRLAGYLTVFTTMLLLPGIAAAGVARDRGTGRLDELITTTFSVVPIYTAKVTAAALPFWAAGTSIFVIMLPVIVVENLNRGLVLRALIETTLQVALVGVISVTSSCVCRHASTARVLAYLAVWIVQPLIWYCIVVNGNAKGHILSVSDYPMQNRGADSYWVWTWDQYSNNVLLFRVVSGLMIAAIGVRRLFPRSRVKKQPIEAAAAAA